LANLAKSLFQAKLRPFLQKTGFANGPTTHPCKKFFDFSSFRICLQAFNSKYRSIFQNNRNIPDLSGFPAASAFFCM
jgi:hypothetical protein